jgi:hypothetical protein
VIASGSIFASLAHSLAHTREYFYERAAAADALLERQNKMNRRPDRVTGARNK